MKTAGGILFGISMAILWSAALESPIGILMGISFGLCMTVAFNSPGKKEEKSDQKEAENGEDHKP